MLIEQLGSRVLCGNHPNCDVMRRNDLLSLKCQLENPKSACLMLLLHQRIREMLRKDSFQCLTVAGQQRNPKYDPKVDFIRHPALKEGQHERK